MWKMINKINGKIKDKSCVIDYLKITLCTERPHAGS